MNDREAPSIVMGGLDRPNVYLEVLHNDEERDREKIRNVLASNARGIVYVNTRRRAEEVCDMLQRQYLPAVRFHGGLSSDEKTQSDERWREGTAKIMVATVAFGLGVDVSDVRYVLHFEPPLSITRMYQELGRAGRDGQRAQHIVVTSVNLDAHSRRVAQSFDLQSEYDIVAQYMLSPHCRRAFLLHALGDTMSTPQHTSECCDVST